MNNTLKITSNFGNKYELAQSRLKNSKFYNEEAWRNVARGKSHVDLDMYIAALQYMNNTNIDLDKFYKDYNYENSDINTQVAAITNEYLKDTLMSSTITAERQVYDDKGNPIKKDGKFVTEKYDVSEYDYYKGVIKQQNDYNYEMYLQQVDQERKDSMNGFVKFMAGAAGVGLDVLSGASSIVDGIVSITAGTVEGISAASNGNNFNDAFVEAVANEDYRPFDDFQDWVVDFESRYTGLRDLNGYYTNLGKYVGGAATSVGQMLPSIALTVAGGAAGTAIGGTAGKIVSTAAGVVSQVVFYEGITANNIRDMYESFAAEGISVPSAAIIGNAAISSTIEWGIERLLGKILGGSVLDDLVFGRTAGGTVGKVTGKTLTKNAIWRVVKDAGQEGLEEVLQDTATFFVDKGYSAYYKKNFGEEHLTWQSLMDAFIIGAIVSVGGSAVNILGTSGKNMRKLGKGGKLAAWEYGLNVKSFVENYNTVIEANAKTKSKVTAAAMTEMYAAYRIVSSIYGEIGEARFTAANNILNKITEDINKGAYDVNYIQKQAQEVYDSVFSDSPTSIQAEILQKIEDAAVTELAEQIERGEDLSIVDESISKEVAEIFKANPNLKKVAITEDGTNTINSKDTVVTPKNLLKNAGAEVVIRSCSENDLVDEISKNERFKAPINEVHQVYKELTGRNDATLDEAIRALLFDPDATLYKALLVTANKDMYKLLSNLTSVVANLKIEKQADAVYKDTIKKSIKNLTAALVQYLKNQPNANYNLDFLTDAQKNSIKKARWCNDIYSRVVRGDAISKTDMTVLTNRVNGMNVDDASKKIILENLKSNNADVRANAMNAIDYAYDKVFTSDYDGETYMPQTNIPNVVFTNYMQRLGLTLKTLVDESALTESDKALIVDSYNEINPTTILKYRTEQFSRTVNNAYTIVQEKGKYYVHDNKGKRVGYSYYNRKIDNIAGGDDVYFKNKKIDRSISTPANELHSIVKGLLKPGVDKLTANMLSITDIIVDSTLLKEEIVNSIKAAYNTVTPETTFMYLRDFILADTGNISITVMPDGDYGFINVEPMETVLKSTDITITKDTKASDIFNEKYLTGMLANLRIVLTDDNIVAEYRPFRMEKVKGKSYRVHDNAIYINRRVATETTNLRKFALMHEFQHAIQYENKMNLGMDASFFVNCKKSVKDAIIADLRKHKPQLFTGKPDRATIEQRVSDFIYHTSGESTAMGMDASPLVDFYPTIVKYTREGSEITFPWGSTFNLEQGMKLFGVSIESTPLTSKLNDELKAKTKAYSLEKFMANPKTCFVMPNGELRTFDEGEHYDIIKSINGNVDVSYWNAIPQVTVEEDFVSVKITGRMSNDAVMNLLSIMDTLYDKNIEFDVSEIFYEDANPYSISVGSDEASNADDLLQLYSRYTLEASGKMSLYKIASQFENETLSSLGYPDELYGINSMADIGLLDTSAIYYKAIYKHRSSDFYKKYKHTKIDHIISNWTRTPLNTSRGALSEDIKVTTKDALLTKEGLRYRLDSLKVLQDDLGIDASFEDFINMEISFARVQTSPVLNASPFVSIYGGMSDLQNLYYMLASMYNRSDRHQETLEQNSYLVTGTFKPKDILTYIPGTVLRECLIDPIHIVNSKIYSIYVSDNYGISPSMDPEMISVDLKNVTDVNGNTHKNYTLSDFNDFAPIVTNAYKQGAFRDDTTYEKFNIPYPTIGKHVSYHRLGFNVEPDAFYDIDTEERFTATELIQSNYEQDLYKYIAWEQEFNKLISNIYAKNPSTIVSVKQGFEVDANIYLKTPDGRVITEEEVNTDLGAYIPKMSLAKSTKSVKTETETPSKPKAKSRYLSQREAKGTPLENFYKKGDKVEMSDELKAFVKGSVDVDLPYDIADKIKDGTLKTADVMDWFRNTPLETMDQKMFELINKSYYKNDAIKTPKQLQEHIYDAAYYYATRAVIRASGNYDLLNVDDDKIAKAQIEAFKNISDDAKMTDGRGRKVKVKTVFSRIVNNYYYKGKNQDEPIDISEKYARTLWMRFYDGSLQNAGRIASISKWTAIRGLAVAGELKTLSLDAKVDGTDDESDTLLDLTEDKAALQEMVDLVTNSDVSRKEKLIRNRLLKGMITLIQKKYGTTDEAAVKAKLTWRKITQMSADELNSASVKALLSELLDVDYEKVMNSTAVDNAVSKVERTSWSIVNNTNYHVSKIRKYLPKSQLKLFLKENSDLFTEDLKLRPEVTKKPDVKGRMIYKDTSELLPIFERVKEIADDVKMGAYQNKTRLSQFVKAKRTMLAVQEDYLKRLKEPVKKAKDVKTITIEVADDILNIDTTKPMPKALERILDFEFTKPVKSRTQYITNDDDYHFQNNLKTFLDSNAEYLEALTQQDVDDIIDYYTNSEILKLNISESKYRLYNAVQLYMSVYLLRGNKLGVFTLTDEQHKALEKRTEVTVSVAAQQLSDWKSAMKLIKPEEIIVNSLAKSAGVQFIPSDVDDLTQALYSGDVKRIQAAKQKMYVNAKKNYDGRKHTFLDKLFQFERMAMLSGPGTWVRNIISNAIIGGIYRKGEQKVEGLLDTSEKVGEHASKLIMKLFPNKKWNREKQFKITGTQVTNDVKNFIDVNLIRNGLLDEIVDGLNKYDVRKSKDRTGAENLTDMITRSIATKIFYANSSDIKVLDTAYNFLFKMLSDDKYVTRNMIKYLGKMLTEDNVDLKMGMSNRITEYVAEAYTLAAQDYMHKTNVWNKIDAAIRDRTGPVVYFAYKQFFPFAATSWNWFMEGLNYTPAGLIYSIIQYGNLENTIDKLDEARRKGETTISSRFAEYTIRRNIGKGVIGSIGTLIGILLAAFGVAKLDEEDDKYKLTVGDVTVDITDVFGTQGIYFGMATIGRAIRVMKGEDDFMDLIVTVLDSMLMDSAITDVWTTIRYNETAGEWFAALPMQTLNNMVPNFLKTLSNVAGIYDVKYSAGLQGKIEKLAVNAIPGLVYAMPKMVDVYTGEYQIMYKAQFVTELINRLTPFDIAPLNLSDYEKIALDLGVHKTMLSGKYTINDKDVVLKSIDVQTLNQYYGQLNKKDLEALLNNQLRLKVKNENGTYSKLLYKQMSEKQKKAAFEQIMSKNSQYAKVYILTSKGYKYYASDSEYAELRKLGITKNVYRKTNKLNGFVEP